MQCILRPLKHFSMTIMQVTCKVVEAALRTWKHLKRMQKLSWKKRGSLFTNNIVTSHLSNRLAMKQLIMPSLRKSGRTLGVPWNQ